jgi:large subunit ribosomal protein L25
MIMTLEVETRDSTESSETLRSRGITPAVFYGPKEAATPIAINARKLASVWKEAGETTIIKLSGAGHDLDTLIKDIQIHPVTGQILHVDFYALEKGKKIEIAVPLHFVGEAGAEKVGGVISKALHEVEIEVSAAELPHALEVDLSMLANIGDHISVKDIKLPPSATLKTDPNEIVASATHAAKEEEPAPAAEAAAEGEAGAEATAPAEGEATAEQH